MKRILSLGLFVLMAFTLFVNNSVKVEADIEDNIKVTIEAVVDGDNTDVELYKDPVSYGSNLEVDLGEFEETFAFWIVDGMVDLERDVETTFIATNDFKAIAVFTDKKELDVYIDHSGELLKAVYEGSEVTVNEPTKIGYEFDDWALIVDVNQVKVHKATYTLNHEPVTINGTSYDYNSIVTLTSDDEEFSHWEVDGKVVSYNKDYTFTALRDLTITEVTEGTVSKETIVTLTNLNDYREGYSTYLAQIELHNNDELVEYGLEVDGTLRKANNLHKDTNEFLISTEKDWNKVRSYIIVKRDNEFITLFDEEAEVAESFEVSDEFTGYYTGEGTPTFGDLQGEDFGITSIEETSPGVYTIVLSGTVKVFDDNFDNPNRFGHGGIVALLGLKYNLPPAYANAEGLTEIGVAWTAPIQSQAAFDLGYIWRGSVNTGNYDSLILTSNVYSLKDEDFLKFAVNWGGTKDEGTGYVEYILDISDVVFEEVSVTGVAVNEEALVLMALEAAQLEATITPTNEINKEVTWSSSDENVATVDENGLVTGVSAGEATITVKTVDGSHKAQTTVIVLPTIAEVREISKGTETEFVGVVTGFTDYSEQYSNFDKVFIEDSTAAIVVYRAGFPQDLKVGDRYKVTGKLDSFNGLIQIASGATVEKLESDIELIAPVEVTDLTEIDESYQGKRVDLEGTVVSVSSTGQELVVKVGENQITVRSNSNSADHIVNSHLLTASVGQVVKLHGIHIDWHKDSQLIPTLVEQVEFVMPSDEALAQLVLDAIVNEWENKSFNMGTDATLPQTGDYDSTITWTFASEGIIVEGKWSDVTADKTYSVTVVVTIGDEEVSKVFDITVKFVDEGEVVEPE